MARFPTEEWLLKLMERLNADERYAEVARKWEGDMLFKINPSGSLNQPVTFYLDLWHGKCRHAYVVEDPSSVKTVFILDGPYDNYAKLLNGELEPMQALLTRKLGVKGNMAVLLRNVPTVLDFVRVCRENTDELL